MAGGCIKFLQGQDQLGQNVEFSYKKNAGYGTVLGGCCSLILTIFFAIFIGIQFYAWMFKPSYSESINRGYLPRNSNETYTISTTDFLPTVMIMDSFLEFSDPSNYNNPENWKIGW